MRYGVTITLDTLYFEIEAEDDEIAMHDAFEQAYDLLGPMLWDLSPDCNEVVELDD